MLPPGPLVQQYQQAGITCHEFHPDLPMRHPVRLARMLLAFRRRVDAIAPDLIHSHFVGTTLTMRLALGPAHATPRIFQVPGPLHLESRFFRRMELMTAGASDYWVGSCRWTCDRYRASGVPADRLFLSYYGTDVDSFCDRRTGRLRTELGISPTTPLIGMVAYMYAPKRYLGHTRGLKGHEDLIDAISLCQQTHPDIVCALVGGPWKRAKRYEQRVRRYARYRCGNRVVALGHRHDVLSLYADFDVAVHPSHSENVGGAVESLLMSVPTIATCVGGFPDLVLEGATGWLVPPRNPAELARAIGAALADRARAKSYAARGQGLARELFDIRRTSMEILTIYQQVLQTRTNQSVERPCAPSLAST
jgi:glycosyltransferase involved in cell wall biosynthesis